jgi:hypothetical protein
VLPARRPEKVCGANRLTRRTIALRFAGQTSLEILMDTTALTSVGGRYYTLRGLLACRPD